jgi:rSAM/selenodomain-associated transferase 1
MGLNILLYFVKYPTPGMVKTRLAKTVGDQQAARLYQELAEKNFREIMLLHQKRACELVVVFDPPQDKAKIEKWFSFPCDYWPQCEGGLGERLEGAFAQAFQKGARRVMVLGSDTLGLTADVVEDGFAALDSNDVVIGPAEDGGYYMIGCNSFYPAIFSEIPWSTGDVLPQTVKMIERLGLRHQTMTQLSDLDEIKTGEER